MNNKKLLKLNLFIGAMYESLTFAEFLKLAIFKLHELVMYDSAMFFCGISRDCSFFKPYIGGNIEEYYIKQPFTDGEGYIKSKEEEGENRDVSVFKAIDYLKGSIRNGNEPRSSFLLSQDMFNIACIRIVYKDQFMGEIYLHRSKEKPDFDAEDMFVLSLLQPHVSKVFNIIHTITAIKYLEQENGKMTKKGLCVLDKELSLTGGNATGMELLKLSTVFGSSILYHIKEQCEDLLSGMHGGNKLVSNLNSVKTNDGKLLIDIVAKSDDRRKDEVQFYITMEFEDEEQVISEYKYKFTKREADIIDGIVQGKNNTQIAGNLKLSENTVKTHIQNIYRKVGANNRTELTYILMMNSD